ncbi:HAMP domain-containing sensor histidine kinase [uncultured Dokdonia sp.]|uniref:sensor histidine kinase n=1 Tax=uncultured Dokdonia sp. TaxID=575653 RepID=UPI0026122775|nr:HAMP domain-containing sensor histidine kinase [uncultured Dokdonia sp.]
MSFRLPKKYYSVFALFAIISGILVFWADSYITEKEKENRKIRLEKLNKKTASDFQNALNNYATLMSGIRSYVKLSNEFPSQEALHQFVDYQLSSLPIDDSYVISYIDSTHFFKYSFTKDLIDPSDLIGTSIKDLVSEKGVKLMEKKLKRRDYVAFNPYNIVEGRVGLPIGFKAYSSLNKDMGYFSIIKDFKPIIDRVYSNIDTTQYTFRFKTSTGVEFDRERVYDGKKIYNTKKDEQYWRNFDLKDEDFIGTQIPFFNKKFIIETAYKDSYKRNPRLLLLMILWYTLLLSFMLFIIIQLYFYKRKNRTIAKQKKELSELVATKNKFFTIIAHDLRSPLSSVINFLDLLKEEQKPNNQTNQIIEALGDSSKNSLSLLDNLLKWSKIQTGKTHYEPQKIDILSLVKDQIKTQKQQALRKNINIVIEASTDVKVMADKNMIATVVRNLLSNAIKYSHPDGVVVIELNKVDTSFSFSIEDNGIGMPEEYLNSLFDVTKITTQKGTLQEKGSGLGLILSKQFIEIHNGILTIESTQNKGTITSFTLPV